MTTPAYPPVAAVLTLGTALAIKPQAVFLAPVLLGYLRAAGVTWRSSLLWLPVPYIVLAVPMLLAGREWFSIIRPYPYEILRPVFISQGAASLWALIPAAKSQVAFIAGCVLAGTVGLGVARLAERRMRARSLLAAISVAAFSCTLMPFLLPKMHDRYLYLGEVLTVIAACLNPQPQLMLAVAFGQVSALLAYQDFLLNLSGWRQPVGAVLNIGVLCLLVVACCGAEQSRIPSSDS